MLFLIDTYLHPHFWNHAVFCVLQLPGNIGEHRYGSPDWPGPERRTPEQCTASKMTVAHEGLFGATVLQYLQSLQSVRESSESESPQDASLGSEQASLHDYTRLCPAGLCSHERETTSSSFPLRLQWALGLSSDSVLSLEHSLPGQRNSSVDSPECSLPGEMDSGDSSEHFLLGERNSTVDSPECSLVGERGKMYRINDSVAVATWSCCDGPHDFASQESGYGEASGDKEEPSGSFSSTPPPPAESLACFVSQSFFLDELLAHAFPTPFTQLNLSTESLSVGSCSRSSGVGTSQNQECSHRTDSSQPSDRFDSQVDSPRGTPEALVSDSEEGSYNCSAELFDDVSGLDRKDMHRPEQVRGRPRKSVCPSSVKQGRPRTPLCHPSIRPGRPRTPVYLRSIKPGRPQTPVYLRSIKLAPVSQSTPILCRAAPQNQRLLRLRDQHKETSHRALDPESGPWETGIGADGQIKCSSIDNGFEIECSSIDEACCGQIECTSIDEGGQNEFASIDERGQIECPRLDERGQTECASIDERGQTECARLDESGQTEWASRDGFCCRSVGGPIECTSLAGGQAECTSKDVCQIECCSAGEGHVKCPAGDGCYYDDTGLPREEADWSQDLFVHSHNE